MLKLVVKDKECVKRCIYLLNTLSSHKMKIQNTRVTLKNGYTFDIIHRFKTVGGTIYSVFAAVENCQARMSDFFPESFVTYVKEKQPAKYIMAQ